MKYLLTVDYLGKNPEVEISAERFETLCKSRDILISILDLEEKFDLLLSNFIELESVALNFSVEIMVRGKTICNYESLAKNIRESNRRLANLLTATKLYIDHIKKEKIIFSKDNLNIEKLTNIEYDKCYSYRFMEALRNHIQHRGLGIHYIHPKINTYDKQKEITVKFFSIKKELKSAGKFKSEVLSEMPEKQEILKSARDYIGSISSFHYKIRKHTEQKIQESRCNINKAIEDYKILNNGKAINLTAIKLKNSEILDRNIIHSIPILLEWDDSRVGLENTNKPSELIRNFFVSNKSE